MAGIYSYKQFEDAARAAGLYEQFSTADLSLAQKNPDAGMSLLKYKQDYAAATTDAARALANQGAEEIRSSYGGYTGGGDGGSFHLEPLSPSSFTYDAAPTYTNRYDEEANKLMQEILNREEFSYDPNTDPLYSSYKKQYTREGQRATQDAIGAAAGATGGIPSSYAVTAASQAGDYYASKIADKVPELEELAYNKHMNEYNMKVSDLDVVRSAEESDYAKFLDQLNQYNTDRSFAYGQHLDEIDSQTAERAEALEKAMLAAEYGDYSFLEKMGVTPDLTGAATTDSGMDIATALKLHEAGDSRYLAALGIDPGYNDRVKMFADVKTAYPDGVLDDATWNSLVAQYGEDTVRAAGFTKTGETALAETGGTGTDSTGTGGGEVTGTDENAFQTVYDSIVAAVAGGASRQAVLESIANAPLTEEEKRMLISMLPMMQNR